MSITVVFILLGVIGVVVIGAFAFVFVGTGTGRQTDMRELMGSGRGAVLQRTRRSAKTGEEEILDIEKIKQKTGRSSGKKQAENISQKLFRAGLYTVADRKRFQMIQIITPIVACPILAGLFHFWLANPMLTTSGAVLGLFIGLIGPNAKLDKRIRLRQEDTLYYLPLVIEQVSIGVSSSLDIGPCISNILQMADERGSHNPVTEMLVHVEKLMRSGLSLEDSLIEVGETNGMTEVKHTFMFLAQCAKHGGEITKQLQELADSVMMQRQVMIEGKITALPVKATGPLATVFAGFFGLLFAGLLVRLMSAFGS